MTSNFKRGQHAYLSDRGYGRYAVTICGARLVNGEQWLLVKFDDRKGRMCVHLSSLVAA